MSCYHLRAGRVRQQAEKKCKEKLALTNPQALGRKAADDKARVRNLRLGNNIGVPRRYMPERCKTTRFDVSIPNP